MVKAHQRIDGNNILYHFLQKELRATDYWLFQMLTARLIVSLGIWFHPNTYSRLPLLLPFAIRDPLSRGNKSRGIPDQWGAPNADGYFRDDNSLIKGLPRQLAIQSPLRDVYANRFIGNGFVASHVWREVDESAVDPGLASRHPLTYSFIPNLVWLPIQVSKLTDREGSFTQHYLQAISHKVYREVDVPGAAKHRVDEAWSRLPRPAIPVQGLPEVTELHFFEPSNAFVDKRRRQIASVVEALNKVASGLPVGRKVVSTRYGSGLQKLPAERARTLATDLASSLGESQISS